MAIGIPNPSPNQNPPQPNSNRPRWADEDDGDISLDLLLPPLQVMGPDKNGIKKVIQYSLNEDGNRVRKTSTIRLCKLANTRLSRQALARRAWPKFEVPEVEDRGNPTVISTEEVFFRKSIAHGTFLSGFFWLFLYTLLLQFSCHVWLPGKLKTFY